MLIKDGMYQAYMINYVLLWCEKRSRIKNIMRLALFF